MDRPLLKGFFPRECVHSGVSAPPLTVLGISDPRMTEWVRAMRARVNEHRALDDVAPDDVTRQGTDATLAVVWRVVVEPILRGSGARLG